MNKDPKTDKERKTKWHKRHLPSKQTHKNHAKDDNIQRNQTLQAFTDNTPGERQNAEEITEVIQMEERDQDNKSSLSSISLLNTDDIEALDKAQKRGKCGGCVHLNATKYEKN